MLRPILVVVIAVLVGIHQIYLKPFLRFLGVGRVVDSLGNNNCTTFPDLQACEKIVLHQLSGILYLACSTPSSRVQWLPAMNRFNATGQPGPDYVATYNPRTSTVSRLDVTNLPSRGFSSHGMDVVPSSSNPNELFLYLVNHRTPAGGKNVWVVGADSSIEIFKTTVGSQTMVHHATIEDPLIITPNDVVGSPDGKSFHVTNDYGTKVGAARILSEYFHPQASVVYCHVEHGCKFAASNMFANNGIARAKKNDTFYVTSALKGNINILERQADDTLVLTDEISTDRIIDNISVDNDGVVWVAGFPKAFSFLKHSDDPTLLSPSSAFKFSINTGPAAFYGEKFKVEKVFEDDGTMVSGATTVVHDSERGRLFFHGLSSPWLTVCAYDK